MVIDRTAIAQLADFSDLETLNLRSDTIDDRACALLGYQRTKQISRKSRLTWESGNPKELLSEVAKRKGEIIRGAFLEIYQEYLPLKTLLKSRTIGSVCDIGCGQGINNLFLQHDFAPRFALVDIEETDDQYHFWAAEGSGYASLDSAKALLIENGVSAKKVTAINPNNSPWGQNGQGFDLVTSLFSCGFHYPVDPYIALFLDTIDNGGAVCLDLRNRYFRRGGDAIDSLKNAGDITVVFEDNRSSRYLFHK